MTGGSDVMPGVSEARARLRYRLVEVLAFGASLVSLQGVPFVTQWIGGRVLGAEEFGQIRVAEVVLGIMLLIGGLGQPTSALRASAEPGGGAGRGSFGGAALLAAAGGSVVAALGIATAGAAPWLRGLSTTLVWLLVALPFSAVSRVVAARFQARRQFIRCAGATAVPAVLSVLAVTLGSTIAGLRGWAFGRVAGEVAPALVLLVLVRHELGRPTRAQLVASLRFGVAMALSLAFDRLAAGIDSLVLASAAPEPRLLGQYGAATLLTQMSTLPAGAIVGVMLPGLIAVADQPAQLGATLRRFLPPFGLGCVVLAAVLTLGGPRLLNTWLSLDASTAWPFLPALVVAAVAGALATFGGAVLIALGRGRWAVAQSFAAAAVGCALGAVLLPRYGLPGLAAAAAAAALVRLALMAGLVRGAVR